METSQLSSFVVIKRLISVLFDLLQSWDWDWAVLVMRGNERCPEHKLMMSALVTRLSVNMLLTLHSLYNITLTLRYTGLQGH